ncbi:MAG TPA: N-acetyltransferase [Lachnospiraceae bacterium]|nr:N-acetyltransferase [Lachnospiraceae bacterium]
MNINVIKGSIEYIDDCEEAIVDSELGKQYFQTSGSARRALEEGFSNDKIYVAVDNDNACYGFIWIIKKGIFHSFPYIHIIAVKKDFRGQGLGKVLLQFAEKLCFEESSKLFLVVADFNLNAKRLYERIGYSEVGEIPSLYRDGITEYLMMKSKE